MAFFFCLLFQEKSSALSNRNLQDYNLTIFGWMTFVNVASQTRRAIKCTRAMFTRVNFTCVDSCVSIKASLIGKTITAHVTDKCLRSHGVVKNVFGAVCQAAENFSTVLARIRAIIVVVVHMFSQIGLAPECFVAYFAHKLSLAVTYRAGGS